MSEIQNSVMLLQSERVKSFELTADAFARSRFMLRSSEYGDNEEEIAVLQNIAENIKCTVETSDGGVSLNIDFDNGDRGNYLEVVENGMPAPQTGGDNGVVTNPDGSTRLSEVPQQLWGNPIEEYSEQGSEILQEIKTMLTSLFKTYVEDVISDCRSEITKIAKEYVENELRKTQK